MSAQCGRVDTLDWYRADTPVPSTDRYDIRLAQRDILVLARSLSWLPHSTNTTRDSVSCPAQYLTDSFTRSPDSPRENGKASPYTITERSLPELIPVVDSLQVA